MNIFDISRIYPLLDFWNLFSFWTFCSQPLNFFLILIFRVSGIPRYGSKIQRSPIRAAVPQMAQRETLVLGGDLNSLCGQLLIQFIDCQERNQEKFWSLIQLNSLAGNGFLNFFLLTCLFNFLWFFILLIVELLQSIHD